MPIFPSLLLISEKNYSESLATDCFCCKDGCFLNFRLVIKFNWKAFIVEYIITKDYMTKYHNLMFSISIQLIKNNYTAHNVSYSLFFTKKLLTLAVLTPSCYLIRV